MGKNFTSASKEDCIYTPYSLTEQLLENEKFDYNKTFLEPACGNGAIVKILKKHIIKKWHNSLIYSDINYKLINKNEIGLDFINDAYEPFDYIITNPPYSKLDKFIIKAKEIATEKFAFLCKLTHLGGVQRFNSGIFQDKAYPLTKIYLFTRQANLRFTNDEQEIQGYARYREIREDGKYPAGMYYYCWLIWEKLKVCDSNGITINYPEFPIFKWINNDSYILRKDCI